MGGAGVSLFERKNSRLINWDDEELSLPFLNEKYKTNYLIQECLTEPPYLSNFNTSSINTIRLATYRDVESGKICIIGGVLRIGSKDSFVDNACSGGRFVRIFDDGKLDRFVCDEYGTKSSVHNGIDFSQDQFIIPNYDRIKDFAVQIAKRMPHMSLFANDIIVDENGNMKLIEVNTQLFSYWFFQFYDNPIFGDNLNTLLEHCFEENKKNHRCTVS